MHSPINVLANHNMQGEGGSWWRGIKPCDLTQPMRVCSLEEDKKRHACPPSLLWDFIQIGLTWPSCRGTQSLPIPSRYCTFCKQEPETVEHLFVSCPEVRRLWSELIQYLNEKYNMSLKQPGAREIILNKLTEHPNNHVVNFICLITKQFIYRQCCCKEQIHFNTVICVVNKVENIEKYIASKNGKLKVHMRKWHKNASSNNGVENVNEFLNQYIENM